jgi:hypothetical protein
MHIGLGGLLLLGLLGVLLFGTRRVLIRLAWIIGVSVGACIIVLMIAASH